MSRETASGFESMCRRQHMPPVPTARLARFFINRGNCPRLREHVSPPTHVPGAHRALGALNLQCGHSDPAATSVGKGFQGDFNPRAKSDCAAVIFNEYICVGT